MICGNEQGKSWRKSSIPTRLFHVISKVIRLGLLKEMMGQKLSPE